MKKKFISSVVAALMVLTMGTTVFAAPSVTTDTVKTESGKASATVSVNADAVVANAAKATTEGATVKEATTSEDVEKTVANVNSKLSTAAGVADVLEKAGVADATATADNKDATVKTEVVSVLNLTGTAGAKVTVTVPGIVAGDKVVVLHIKDDGTSEYLAATVDANGKITFTAPSFSTFAIVKVTVSAPEKVSYNGWAGYPWGATTETAAATTAATSPKTADAAPVLPVLAVICLAGVVVCGKKVKFNN